MKQPVPVEEMSKDYPKQDITGVILAGGRAERMGGQDKGLLVLAGRPLAAHALERLRPQVGQVLINANRNRDAYAALGAEVVADSLGGFQGPLAGMLTALERLDGGYIATVPCDSPLLAADYVARMWTARAEQGAALAVARCGGWLQPVFALLERALAADLRAALLAGERKIDRWFACHPMVLVDFDDHPEMFRNINTPQELAELERELAGNAGSP
ncbi:MAG TPA: molybdenum cofactor guanylyltransferase MobA [Candidatus Competibacteraceae bacterium]|nr:molybdenum cofactor guanylyltransferase MobA [Candidatus Competibacteraceae bacterium]